MLNWIKYFNNNVSLSILTNESPTEFFQISRVLSRKASSLVGSPENYQMLEN